MRSPSWHFVEQYQVASQVVHGIKAFSVQYPHFGCSILGPKEEIETRGPKIGLRREVIEVGSLVAREDFLSNRRILSRHKIKGTQVRNGSEIRTKWIALCAV